MGTDTGTKDKYFHHFVENLQTQVNQWREEKATWIEKTAKRGEAERGPATVGGAEDGGWREKKARGIVIRVG